MTYSILTYDRETGTFAAAAATGNLCVGGWVLRGDIESGLVASQGTAPSTFWREEVLRQMHSGTEAGIAIANVIQPDQGRGHRQIIALDLRIDYHDNPLAALKQLCDRAHGLPYHGWLGKVPVLVDRSRHP